MQRTLGWTIWGLRIRLVPKDGQKEKKKKRKEEAYIIN
jgi:hypothetical protein